MRCPWPRRKAGSREILTHTVENSNERNESELREAQSAQRTSQYCNVRETLQYSALDLTHEGQAHNSPIKTSIASQILMPPPKQPHNQMSLALPPTSSLRKRRIFLVDTRG